MYEHIFITIYIYIYDYIDTYNDLTEIQNIKCSFVSSRRPRRGRNELNVHNDLN